MNEENFQRLLRRIRELDHWECASVVRACLTRMGEIRTTECRAGVPIDPPEAGEPGGRGATEKEPDGDPIPVPSPSPSQDMPRLRVFREGVSQILELGNPYSVCSGFGVIYHRWKGREDVLVLNCFEDDEGDFNEIRVYGDGWDEILHVGCIPPEWCVWLSRFPDGEKAHFEALGATGAVAGSEGLTGGLTVTGVGGRWLVGEPTGKIGGGQGIYPHQRWFRGSAAGAQFTFDEMKGRAQRHPMWRLDREEMEEGRMMPKLYDEPASLVTASNVFPKLSRYKRWSARAHPFTEWLPHDEQHLSRFTGPVKFMADLGDPTAQDLLRMLGYTVDQAWTMRRSEFRGGNTSYWSLHDWMDESLVSPLRQGASVGTGSPALGREAAHTLRALRYASDYDPFLQSGLHVYRDAIRRFMRDDGVIFWDSSDSYAAPYRAQLGGSGAKLCMCREPQLLLREMIHLGELDDEVQKLTDWLGPHPPVCINVDTGERTNETAPWGHAMEPFMIEGGLRQEALERPFLDSSNPGCAIHPSLWQE